MNKRFATALAVLFSFAAQAGTPPDGQAVHRFLVERTFPAGALDGVDAAAKQAVNDKNASLGVTWVHSYLSADKTKTWCVYQGPSEAAIRQAAALNGFTVDSIVEIPNDLEPK